MQEPIDSSGELMKDRRYGTGLHELAYGSAEYWYAEYVRERETHMRCVQVLGRMQARLEDGGMGIGESTYRSAMLNLRGALNETEGSDDN